METQSEVEHTGRMKEEDTRTCLTEPDRFEDGEWLTEHQTCRLGPGRRLDSLLRKNSRQIQIGDCIISLIAWNRTKSKTGLFRSYSRQRSKSLRGRIPAPGACAGPNGFGIKKILFGWEYLTAEITSKLWYNKCKSLFIQNKLINISYVLLKISG